MTSRENDLFLVSHIRLDGSASGTRVPTFTFQNITFLSRFRWVIYEGNVENGIAKHGGQTMSVLRE